MKYQLQEGEEVLMELKPAERAAWYFMVSKTWHVLFLLIFAFFWMFAAASWGGQKSQNTWMLFDYLAKDLSQKLGINASGALFLIIAIVLIFGLIYIFFLSVIRGYSYVITNQRMIISYGFIVLNHRIIPLEKINDLSMNATLFERIFGLGSVYVSTLGTLFSGFNGMANSTGFMGGGRSSFANNSTRLECLSLEQCDEVMAVISKAMKQVGIKSQG